MNAPLPYGIKEVNSSLSQFGKLTTTNSINTDPNFEEGNADIMIMKPPCFGDDADQERSEAELARRKKLVIEKLEAYDDSNPAQIIKSKQKSLYLQTRSTRGSKFRGVSRNGKKWQVRILKYV